VFVGECNAHWNANGFPNLGHAVSIFDHAGNRVGRFGDGYQGSAPNQFISGPHGLALDSQGNFYGAEVSFSFLVSRGQELPLGEIISLRKWRRVGGSAPKQPEHLQAAVPTGAGMGGLPIAAAMRSLHWCC
jgi:hypothetical protein